ncbi:MAG: branched-chain amino acid ABC transporter substrate-binding protein, partial [Pseudonocardia sp.]|nr:branched-chain amino acid ABC transporter substrate-binding protein [Pseudonocardia sp.]
FQLTALQSDDAGTTTGAPPAAAALIQDTSVMGVVGPAFSGPTTATGAKYAEAGLALISPSATNATLTSQGFTTFHRIVPTDGIEGKATADYLATKYKSVYVVDDTSTYGAGVAQVVTAELKSKNVKVDTQSIAPTTDYTAVAQKVASSGDQAMYYGGYDAQAGLLAKSLKGASYAGFVISGNGAKSSVFTSTAGASGDGFYFACGCLDATTAPSAKDFNDAYTKKFGTPPSTYSPEAYDATNAMIAAMSAAAKNGTVTRATVETAVNGIDYKGITTEVKFASNGEVAQATVNLYEQKNGAIALLGDITKQ